MIDALSEHLALGSLLAELQNRAEARERQPGGGWRLKSDGPACGPRGS
jgi:hypothetical protein